MTASRGKVVRAEPISALYEQGRSGTSGSLPNLRTNCRRSRPWDIWVIALRTEQTRQFGRCRNCSRALSRREARSPSNWMNSAIRSGRCWFNGMDGMTPGPRSVGPATCEVEICNLVAPHLRDGLREVSFIGCLPSFEGQGYGRQLMDALTLRLTSTASLFVSVDPISRFSASTKPRCVRGMNVTASSSFKAEPLLMARMPDKASGQSARLLRLVSDVFRWRTDGLTTIDQDDGKLATDTDGIPPSCRSACSGRSI